MDKRILRTWLERAHDDERNARGHTLHDEGEEYEGEYLCIHELHDGTACGATFPTMKAPNARVIFAHQLRNEHSLAIRANTCLWCMSSFASKASCIRR
eukprot:1518587-Pyramimonas_sp.AAC.2